MVRNVVKVYIDIYGNLLENKVLLIIGVFIKNEFIGKVYYLFELFCYYYILRMFVYKKDVRDKLLWLDEIGFIVDNSYYVNRRDGLVIVRVVC